MDRSPGRFSLPVIAHAFTCSGGTVREPWEGPERMSFLKQLTILVCLMLLAGGAYLGWQTLFAESAQSADSAGKSTRARKPPTVETARASVRAVETLAEAVGSETKAAGKARTHWQQRRQAERIPQLYRPHRRPSRLETALRASSG